MTQELIYTGQSDSGQPTGAIPAHASGYCWEGSAAAPRADAWRCFEGNDILDPCFGSVGGPVVVCPVNGPWSDATELTLTKPLPTNTNSSGGTAGAPWAIQLANGDKCLLATGASTVIAGLRLNYFCNKKLLLYGDPQRSTTGRWTIFAGTGTASRLAPVPIATAWF